MKRLSNKQYSRFSHLAIQALAPSEMQQVKITSHKALNSHPIQPMLQQILQALILAIVQAATAVNKVAVKEQMNNLLKAALVDLIAIVEAIQGMAADHQAEIAEVVTARKPCPNSAISFLLF